MEADVQAQLRRACYLFTERSDVAERLLAMPPVETASALEQLLVLHRRAIGADGLLRRKLSVYARLCNCLSVWYLKQNSLEEARFLLKKAEFLSNNLPLLRASVYNNLAIYYRRCNRLRGALKYLQMALAIEQRFAAGEIALAAAEDDEEAAEQESDVNPATTHLNICAVLSRLSRHLAALEHAKHAVDILHKELAAGEGAGRVEGRARSDKVSVLGVAYFNLGAELEHLGRVQAAEEAFGTGHQLVRDALGEEHPLAAALLRSAAALRRRTGGRRLPLEVLHAQVKTKLRSIDKADFPLENLASFSRAESSTSRRVQGLRMAAAAAAGRGEDAAAGGSRFAEGRRPISAPATKAQREAFLRSTYGTPPARTSSAGSLRGPLAPPRSAGPRPGRPEPRPGRAGDEEAALASLEGQPVRPHARGPAAGAAGAMDPSEVARVVRELLAESGSESEGEREAGGRGGPAAQALLEGEGGPSEADASWAIFDRELDRLRATLTDTINTTAKAFAAVRPGSATSTASRPRSASASQRGL